MTMTNEEREQDWQRRQREFDERARREREEVAREHAARLRQTADDRLHEQIPLRYALAKLDAVDIRAWLDARIDEATNEDPWTTLRTVRPNEHGHYGLNSGPSLLILGPVGTGKTHQAYALVKVLFAEDYFRDIVITTAVELYAALRPRPGIDSEAEFQRYARADLLMLDDLGTGKNSEWVEETNYRLIDYRYSHELVTIFTSNVPPRELGERLGDRTASRLTQMCATVVLKGQDRRRAA
jgi:DNA replication protein DnaC